MKFTLGWLKDHLDTDAGIDDLVHGLIGGGLEVESLTDRRQTLAPFSIAHVRATRRHPNAERLQVCDVETEAGLVQVVCGAANARAGIKAVFAPIGTHIPGTGLNLKKVNIRGVESNGMLCSEREIELSNEHDGIIELADDSPVGTPAAVALGLDDPVFDIAITPNRPDALGVHGIARDLAAKGLGTLKPPTIPKIAAARTSQLNVALETPQACPLFIAWPVCRVKNRPSPVWLQNWLRAVGLRPISALVDITNYMTLTYGRPLHVFDADRLAGETLTVRSAHRGETLDALDGHNYTLKSGMTVIADASGAVGLGGIIGGETSACGPQTVNVVLEVALFDPVRTARTGRLLNIQSDARYRFERGVDPHFAEPAAQIAVNMIVELCGGEPCAPIIAGQPPNISRHYTLRKGRVCELTGLDLPSKREQDILQSLGFEVNETASGLDCVAPSWRPDIHGEADLVEEICRIVGLDAVPSTPIPRVSAVARPVLTLSQRRVRQARQALAARGLDEAVAWSFAPARAAELFGGGEPQLKLINPISAERSDMRPSILATLMAEVRRNMARGLEEVGLFEIGPVYKGDRPEDQTLHASGVRRGMTAPRHWAGDRRGVDAFDAKADALAVLEACGAPVDALQTTAKAPEWFHPGRSGTLCLGPKIPLARFGEIHPRILAELDVNGPLAGFEVMIDSLPQTRAQGKARPPLELCDLMAIKRDFAFILEQSVESGQVVKAARAADRQLISAVSVFDLFEGAQAAAIFGPCKKSLAIEVTLQPRERTLREEDIEAVSRRIIAKVEKATGGKLRC
ncbi:MAG: phenylalanine--tRNA ligase subunit beta [Hyphomicrobiales bacterium]